MSKVSRIRRSSSPSRASPVRHNDAYASVLVGSPPGYSSWKSASTLTTPSVAGEGRRRLPLPGRSGPPASDIREDLDLRHALNPRSPHDLAQGRVVREALGLLECGEVVGDEQVVLVVRQPQHAGRDAAVLGSQRFSLVVDLPPGGVVLDVVPDGKYGAHLVSPFRSGGCLPHTSTVEVICFRVKILVSEINISYRKHRNAIRVGHG